MEVKNSGRGGEASCNSSSNGERGTKSKDEGMMKQVADGCESFQMADNFFSQSKISLGMGRMANQSQPG